MTKKLTLDDLTTPQHLALFAMVMARGLLRTARGYGDGRGAHAPEVIEELHSAGLCVIRPSMGLVGGVAPTEAGWRLVRAALKDTNSAIGTFPASLR